MGGRIVVNGNNVGFLSAPIPFYGHIEVQLIGQEELYLSCSGRLAGTLYVSAVVSIFAQLMWSG